MGWRAWEEEEQGEGDEHGEDAFDWVMLACASRMVRIE